MSVHATLVGKANSVMRSATWAPSAHTALANVGVGTMRFVPGLPAGAFAMRVGAVRHVAHHVQKIPLE